MATKTNMNLNAGFSRVIYVSANVSAEDEQIGSEELPFASLTQATDLMTVDADYTVYIDGEIKGNFTIPAAAESHEKTVSIIGNNKATCILNGNNSGSTLTIGENVKVNLKNLTITGSGRNDGDCGIKMYAENSESTTLDNVNINGNYNGIGFKHGYLYVNSGTEITNNYYGIRTYAISNYWMGDGIRVGGGQILSNTQYDVYYYAQVNMLLWQTCSLTIGGNATIGKIFIKRYGFRYNGVYYYFLNKISISSSLNNHSQANPISVTIDNDNPIDDGGQLLSGSNLAEESKKFRLANEDYYIDGEGYIRKNTNITVNSESEQTVIGNAMKSDAKRVVAKFESDFTLKPLSSYQNSAGFEGDGRDAVVEVPAGKTLVLTAESSVTLDFPCLCGYFFDVSGTLIIGQNITISGINGIHWNAIRVQSGGNVILDGGTIKNSNGGGAGRGAVIIDDGTFVMESGLITDSEGGVFVEGGTFIMNGGEISGNRFSSQEAGGGGVTVTSGAKFIKQPE